MTIWQQIAVCFYQNEIADGMDLFMANAAKLLRESLDSNSRYENAINDDEKYMDALEDAVSNAYDMWLE